MPVNPSDDPNDIEDPDLRVSLPAPDVAVVEVACELDMATAPALEHLLLGRLAAGDRFLVVDLGGCEFLGSSGLAAMARAFDQAQRRGARFALAGMDRRLMRAVEVTGLHGIFETYPSGPAAVAAASTRA